jgi:mannitol-1-/sugar-/sorbitol-6-phosphatase
MNLQCAAILFDLDGVLVDSGPLAERHWRRWAQDHGVPFEHIAAVHHGRPSAETIRLVAPHLNADLEGPRREREEAADTAGLVAFEGAKRLLSFIPRERWAVVTSSKRDTVRVRLTHVGLPMPETLVTADDVRHGKPAAEPYSLAADRLGFPSSRCVVIEDAPSGIESGKASGARVVAIAPVKMEQADFTVRRLADIEIVAIGENCLHLRLSQI